MYLDRTNRTNSPASNNKVVAVSSPSSCLLDIQLILTPIVFGTQPAATGTGPFGGASNTGTSLFGANNANQQQGQQGQQSNAFGLFGGPKPATPAAPAGGGIFGGFGQTNPNNTTNAQPGAGLFGGGLGQSTSNQQSNAFGGGGLFNKPVTPLGGQGAQTAGTGFGGNSLFGSMLGANNAMGQSTSLPSLTASIAQPIGANIPLFNMLPPGPRAVNLDQPKKKAGLFVDVPTRSPVPRLQLGYTPASSKLRGFTSTATIPGAHGQSLGPAVSLTSGRPGMLSISKAASSKSLLGPDAFLNGGGPSPGLGSGSRQSVKKLVLDKKIDPSDLFGKSNAKITFNPALSIAARELEAAAASSSDTGFVTPTPPSKTHPPKAASRFSAPGADEISKEKETAEKELELRDGDYYSHPSIADLKKRSFKELAEVEGLVVGRVGYGEIEFLEKWI